MEGLITREGREEDLDEVLRLWAQMVEFHADLDPSLAMRTDAEALEGVRAFFRACLDSPDSRFFVAEAVGVSGLLGFVLAHVRSSTPIALPPFYGFISDICVDKAFRRQGIGERLYLAARELFQQRQLPLIRVNVAAANPVSQSFWRAMGGSDQMILLGIDIE